MIIATLSTCFTTRRFFQVLCQSLHGYSLIGDFFPFPFSFFLDDEPVVDKSRSLRLIYSRTQTTEGLRRFSIRLLSSFLFFFLSSSKEKKMVENFVLSNEAVKKLFDERDVTRKFRALYSSWRSLAKEAWRCCCR